MSDVNRSVLIILPKQPFVDWLKTWDPEDTTTLDEVRAENTAYLAPMYEYDEDAVKILKAYYEFIFGIELWSWCTDESVWPKNRTFEMFVEWFDYEFHPVVFDLDEETPLRSLEDEETWEEGNGDG